MTTKFVMQRYFWCMFIVLLVACSAPASEEPASTSATAIPTPTIALTPSLVVVNRTPTILPIISTPTFSLPLSSAPEELRIVYIVDRNLYLEDGSKPPLQLTHSEADLTPVFSSDGEKLVFYRGLVPHDLYTVNLDGTRESGLVTGDLFASLGIGYSKFTEIASLAFVPDTHQILFNTRELSQADIDFPDPDRLYSNWNEDLLSLNTDTGELKQILPKSKGGNFYISPDGLMVAIQAKGHIDVISIDGRMIRSHLVTYVPTQPYVLAPNVSWNSDSTNLIVSLPAREVFDMSGPEAFTIWRYSINDGTQTQLTFDPQPLDSCCASPDGNWFLYPYYYYPGKTSDTRAEGLYLGNTHNNSVQFYDPEYYYYHWSPDSVHFVYGAHKLFLGSISEQPKIIDDGQFLGWLDNNRFLYYKFEDAMLYIGRIEDNSIPIFTNIPKRLPLQGAEAFTFIVINRDKAK